MEWNGTTSMSEGKDYTSDVKYEIDNLNLMKYSAAKV